MAAQNQQARRPSAESVKLRLDEAGLDVPAECLAGVAANLAVLADHVQTLRAFVLDPRSASAMTLQ